MEDILASAGGNDGIVDFDESTLPRFSEIDPETATPEQVEELKKAAQTLLGQTKHWKTKAMTPAPSKPNPQPQDSGDNDGRLKRLEESEEKRQFQSAHGLNSVETDHLFAFARGSNIKPTQALEHPFFKQGLEALRQSERANGAIPGPSSRSPVIEGRNFNEMSESDKRKNFSKLVGTFSKK